MYVLDKGVVAADDSLEGLVERIQRGKPMDAYNSYQKLKEAGRPTVVSNWCQQLSV